MSDTIKALLTRRDELRQELAKLDEQIAAQQAAEKRASIERLRALIAEEGLTLADLAGEAKTPRSMTKALPTKGRKIPPKYRDPVTGQAWSGRGIKPRWLQQAMAEGKSIEEFLIKV